jgi:transposase
MRRNLFWLNDDQWQRIAPYLPKDVRGKSRVDDRRVISGIIHVMTGVDSGNALLNLRKQSL